MALFNDTWMEALLSRNDIVSVVSSYVQLHPKGGRLWGLCPFHGEKTPSFSVVPDKQFYYCFGCHKGGGVVQFIMEAERISYIEAIRLLAQRAGMELPGQVDDAALQQERALKERLYSANKEAALFYHKQLLRENGREARAYLEKRGLDADTVKRFGLGAAPQGWDHLMTHMLELNYTKDELLQAGLLVHNKKSDRVYDAYRNRVIFPIIGVNGRVLGFGARAMGEEKPKYINTGDTPVYNKRNHLYGLNMFKGSAQGTDSLIMVEGYMDVIGLYQRGIKNAIASLGTALTQQQARLIKRYVSTVYIAYDGDAAGQNATLRGLDILAQEGLSVRVIVLPEGKDPDEFIRENGKEAFDALRDRSMALNAFKLMRMEKGFDLATEDGREAFAKAACRFISALQPIEQERYYASLSRTTGMTVETLTAQGSMQAKKSAKKEEQQYQRKQIRYVPNTVDDERTAAELGLLRAMLDSHEAAMLAKEQVQFSNEAYTSFSKEIYAAYDAGKIPDPVMILSRMDPKDTERLAGIIDRMPGGTPELSQKTAQDCIRKLLIAQLDEEDKRIRRELMDSTITIEQKIELSKQRAQLDLKRRQMRLQ